MPNYMEVSFKEFPIEESLCFDCKHLVSRVLVPIDPESMGIDREDFDLDDDEELVIEQHTCTALMQDMDSIVLECSKYEELKNERMELFRHDIV